MNTYTIVGARGGHGATTVAVAFAAALARNGRQVTITSPVDHDGLCATGGTQIVDSTEITSGLTLCRPGLRPATTEVHVVDAGRLVDLDPAGSYGTVWCVLRGPDFNGLRMLAAPALKPDGIILITEPGRSLRDRDVTSVTGIEIVCTIGSDASVASVVDAGTLVKRPIGALDQLDRAATRVAP